MEVVERNDVDISSIFNWGRVFEVFGDGKENPEAIVYMKLLGDADVNRSRVYALRESGKLRRKLKDLDSDERLAYIPDIDDVDPPDMISLITALSLREITNEAKKVVTIKKPNIPKSDAPLEEMEKYQADVDAYPQKREDAIKQYVEKRTEEIRKYLEKLSKEELYTKYVKILINELCERRAIEAYKEMQVYLGCFTDSTYKERFFKSFDEFQNLHPEIKKQFIDAYNTLDIDMSELKKLRRATP